MNIMKLKNRCIRSAVINGVVNLFGRFRGHQKSLLLVILIAFHPSLSHANAQGTKSVEVKIEAEEAQPVLMVLGDSLSAAYGISVEQGWVTLLQDALPNYKVVNASISGETTSGGKQRLPTLMKQHAPSVLVVELGANDALRGQNLNATKQNLQTILNACLEAESTCKPVLLGIRLPTNYGPAYDALLQKIYQDLAIENSVAFHPFFLEQVALDPVLMQDDGLHPNALAQPLILDAVLETLKSAEGLLAPISP